MRLGTHFAKQTLSPYSYRDLMKMPGIWPDFEGGAPMTSVTRLTMLPVERNDIERPSAAGREYLTKSIADLARLWIAEGRPSRAMLTISGYDDDPRELCEIPDVCQWANRTLSELPVLPFFLTDQSLDPYVAWLCGPVSRDSLTSPEFQQRFTDTKMRCYTKASAESSGYLTRMGADGPTISKFYFQILADRATKQPLPRKWWQFWK
jgi:hypothetical protein